MVLPDLEQMLQSGRKVSITERVCSVRCMFGREISQHRPPGSVCYCCVRVSSREGVLATGITPFAIAVDVDLSLSFLPIRLTGGSFEGKGSTRSPYIPSRFSGLGDLFSLALHGEEFRKLRGRLVQFWKERRYTRKGCGGYAMQLSDCRERRAAHRSAGCFFLERRERLCSR